MDNSAPDHACMTAGLRALHTEDGGTWVTSGHRVLRLRPEQQAAAPSEASTARADAIGVVLLAIAAAAALAAVLSPFVPF